MQTLRSLWQSGLSFTHTHTHRGLSQSLSVPESWYWRLQRWHAATRLQLAHPSDKYPIRVISSLLHPATHNFIVQVSWVPPQGSRADAPTHWRLQHDFCNVALRKFHCECIMEQIKCLCGIIYNLMSMYCICGMLSITTDTFDSIHSFQKQMENTFIVMYSNWSLPGKESWMV